MKEVFLFFSNDYRFDVLYYFSYGIAAIAPFSHRLAFDNLPKEIQLLRCKVNFHALVFVPLIRMLGDTLVQRLRTSPSTNKETKHEKMKDEKGSGKFIVLHLRFDKVSFLPYFSIIIRPPLSSLEIAIFLPITYEWVNSDFFFTGLKGYRLTSG